MKETQVVNVHLDIELYELLKTVAAYEERPSRQYLRRLIAKEVNKAVAAGKVVSLTHPQMLEG